MHLMAEVPDAPTIGLHSVRKWKYVMRFEKCILCFEIGLSPFLGRRPDFLELY